MINVKDQVYAALRKKLGEEIEITDSYPKTWASLPAVQYMEEENRVYERTDDEEQKAYCRYRIDIWHNASSPWPAADRLRRCGRSVWTQTQDDEI